MGRSQEANDTWGKCDMTEPLVRCVAPGVYFAPDGVLTADSLNNAITYLRGLEESGAPGKSNTWLVSSVEPSRE